MQDGDESWQVVFGRAWFDKSRVSITFTINGVRVQKNLLGIVARMDHSP